MANLYRDIHQVVKDFSEYNNLGLFLNKDTKLKCHFFSNNGFIKAIRLYGAKEYSHYVLKIYASKEVLDPKDFEVFKTLVNSLLTRLREFFPDIKLDKPWTSNPVQYGFAKLTLTNVVEDKKEDEQRTSV